MPTAPVVLLATVANAAMLLASWSHPRHSDSDQDPQVLRAQLIELVDSKGTVRGQLYLGEDGSGQIRLRDAKGNVEVKLGGLNDGGGALLLMDPSVEPAITLAADKSGPSITLSGREGSRVLKP